MVVYPAGPEIAHAPTTTASPIGKAVSAHIDTKRKGKEREGRGRKITKGQKV